MRTRSGQWSRRQWPPRVRPLLTPWRGHTRRWSEPTGVEHMRFPVPGAAESVVVHVGFGTLSPHPVSARGPQTCCFSFYVGSMLVIDIVSTHAPGGTRRHRGSCVLSLCLLPYQPFVAPCGVRRTPTEAHNKVHMKPGEKRRAGRQDGRPKRIDDAPYSGCAARCIGEE